MPKKKIKKAILPKTQSLKSAEKDTIDLHMVHLRRAYKMLVEKYKRSSPKIQTEIKNKCKCFVWFKEDDFNQMHTEASYHRAVNVINYCPDKRKRSMLLNKLKRTASNLFKEEHIYTPKFTDELCKRGLKAVKQTA